MSLLLSADLARVEYSEAIESLRPENINIRLAHRLPQPLRPRAVDVIFQDWRGETLCVFNAGQLLLTHETKIMTLVLQLQTLLDSVLSEQDSLLHNPARRVVAEIEVRIEGNLRTASLPAIRGVPCYIREEFDNTIGPRLDGVVWEHDALQIRDTEAYWYELRESLLAGLSCMVLCPPGHRPVFKVKTFRKAPSEPIHGIEDFFANRKGHLFMTDREYFFPVVPGTVKSFPEVLSSLPKPVRTTTKAAEDNFQKAVHKGLGKKFIPLSFEEEQAAADPQPIPRPPKKKDPRAKMADFIAAKYPKEAAIPFMSKITLAEKEGIHLHGNPSEGDIEFGMLLAKRALESEHTKGNLRDNGEGSSKMIEEPDVFTSYREHLSDGGKPMSDFKIKMPTQAESRMSAPATPKEDWSKWQRMGGDPRLYKTFSLDGAPYPPSPVAGSIEDKNDDTINPVSEKPDTSIRMRGPMSPAEVSYTHLMVQRDKLIKTSVDKSAQAFAEKDDEAFIPKIDNPNEDKGKGKGKAPAWSPKKKKTSEVPPSGLAKNKKVETLRAIFSPGAKQNSMQSSPYLNALGSSGIAPPPGLYNNMASTSSNAVSGFPLNSGMASSFQPNTGTTNNLASGDQAQNQSSMGNRFASSFQTGSGMGNTSTFGYQSTTGLASTSIFANWQPPQNPSQPTMNQASTTSAPLTSWSHIAPVQPLGSGFYDPVYTGPGNGMNTGGRRSSLGHIARTASRSGFQNNIGSALRADSPAFNIAPASLAVRTVYPPAGYGVQGVGSARGRSGTDRGQGGASGSASGTGAGEGGQQNNN